MPNLSAWVFVALAVVQLAHAAPQGISRSARCGPSFGLTCKGSSFGNCCSKYGYCGSTSNHCDSKNGCQTGWGSCSSASSLAATSKISKNGKCGGGSGATCQGSTYGSCCRYVLGFLKNRCALTGFQSVRLLWLDSRLLRYKVQPTVWNMLYFAVFHFCGLIITFSSPFSGAGCLHQRSLW